MERHAVWCDVSQADSAGSIPVTRSKLEAPYSGVCATIEPILYLIFRRFRVFRGFGLVLTRWSAAVSGCARHRVVPPSAGTGSSVGGGSGRAVSSRRACGCVGATSRPDSVCLLGLRYAAAGL